MTFVDFMMVGIGGFLGAVTRYFISTKLNEPNEFPTGTLLVNLFGSLLIGIVFGMELSRLWTLLLASGLVGALTTFSTMNRELLEFWRGGKKKMAIVYVLTTYGGGIGLAATGYYAV